MRFKVVEYGCGGQTAFCVIVVPFGLQSLAVARLVKEIQFGVEGSNICILSALVMLVVP